jgi:uncharacterized membrane protein
VPADPRYRRTSRIVLSMLAIWLVLIVVVAAVVTHVL